MKRRLLVLDFDQTITDWNGALPKSRAEKLARLLNVLQKKYNMGVIILSMANKAHIMTTVYLSHCPELIRIFNEIPLITIENRRMVFDVDPTKTESVRKKNRMIEAVMGNRLLINEPDVIRAYKKTNMLLTLSQEESVAPHDIFFLDDNYYNIHFANYFHFRTFPIDNTLKSKTLKLFTQLKSVEKILKSYGSRDTYTSV